MSDPAPTVSPPRPLITPDGRRKIIVLGVASFILAVLSFFTPVNSQQRNMRAAQRHIDIIAPRFRSDPRFREVELQPYTGGDCSLGVLGTVANAYDLAELKRLIEDSKPPVQIFFAVLNREEFDRQDLPAE